MADGTSDQSENDISQEYTNLVKEKKSIPLQRIMEWTSN